MAYGKSYNFILSCNFFAPRFPHCLSPSPLWINAVAYFLSPLGFSLHGTQ